MAKAKTAEKSARAISPEQFIAKLPEPERTDIARLHALIVRTVPKLEPRVAGAMLEVPAS